MKARLELKSRIIQEAKKIGFHLVGMTPALPVSDIHFYEAWISKSCHADMDYLKGHLEKKRDPRQLLASAKSIICCGLSYQTADTHPIKAVWGEGLVSNYAWGDDYHKILTQMLEKLNQFLKRQIPTLESKIYVDTGPLLERSYAREAGLGWIGKNTCLINQQAGSYIFLGEMITNLDLDGVEPEVDHCGSCQACIEACPTQALKPYELNAHRCIAYLTIEKRGDFTPEQKKWVGDHLFGCDICQQVCPWNGRSLISNLSVFRPREGKEMLNIQEIQNISQEAYHRRFKNSPLKRAKLEGLKRNASAVIQNQSLG